MKDIPFHHLWRIGIPILIAFVCLIAFPAQVSQGAGEGSPAASNENSLPANVAAQQQNPLYDLSSATLTLQDLPAGFSNLSQNQLSSMAALGQVWLTRVQELDPTTQAQMLNLTGFTNSDPSNIQIIVGLLISPLSSAEQVVVDQEFTNPDMVMEMFTSMMGSSNIERLAGSGRVGNTRLGLTMLVPAGAANMQLDFISARRGPVIIEIISMYREGSQPLSDVIDLAEILDNRVMAVVGVGSGVAFRASSEFVPELTTYIPRPTDISTRPSVISANLLLAALMMLPFAVAAELFTRTLSVNEVSLRKKFKPLEWLSRFSNWLNQRTGAALHRPAWRDILKLLSVMFFYGFIFSLLEPNWNPFTSQGLSLLFYMTIAYGVVGIADDIAQWRALRKWGQSADLDLRSTNVLLAVFSVAISRLFFLIPGLMFGTPEALNVDETTLDEKQRDRLVRISAITFTVIILAFWIPTLITGILQQMDWSDTVIHLIAGVEAFLLVIFAVALENTFVQMLGFPGSFGESLKKRSRGLWLTMLVVVTFLFIHTLINPRGELAEALQEGDVILSLGLAAAFVVVAFFVWFAYGRVPRTPVLKPQEVPHNGSLFESHQQTTTLVSEHFLTTIPPAAPVIPMEKREQKVTGETKACPVCGEDIKAEALICRYCRARFSIQKRGYCQTCHILVDLTEEKCPRCGSAILDPHIISRLVSIPEKVPTTSSPQPAVEAGTRICPHCGQVINADARICRFCRNIL